MHDLAISGVKNTDSDGLLAMFSDVVLADDNDDLEFLLVAIGRKAAIVLVEDATANAYKLIVEKRMIYQILILLSVCVVEFEFFVASLVTRSFGKNNVASSVRGQIMEEAID